MKPHILVARFRALSPPGAARPVSCGALRRALGGALALLALCGAGTSLAAPAELGRLFYTPSQRDQLERARAHNVTQAARLPQPSSPAPLRYDGVLIRSDGQTTHWVDGKAQVGSAGVRGLKPGQIRAGDKVYEPYQVLRPAPAAPVVPETAP